MRTMAGSGSASDGELERRENAARFISKGVAWRYRILPLEVAASILIVGRAGDLSQQERETLERDLRKRLIVRTMPDVDVVAGLRQLYAAGTSTEVVSDESVDQRFNALIESALDQHVGDIHFEWSGTGENSEGEVLFRIDRALYLQEVLNKGEFEALIRAARGAVNASDTTPFETKTAVYHTAGGRATTLRVQTLPDYRGAVCVIRLVGGAGRRFTLAELRFPEEMEMALRGLIRRPGGIVLIVGPPHSGKTTTMWTLVSEIVALISKNMRRVKILSAEDAVEIPQEHATQIEIADERGISYPEFLTGANRSDVDISVQGEIPDADSAFHTFSLALAVRYMFASLHARDAYSALLRLIEWDIPTSVLASGLRAIVVQRLVPLLCQRCKLQAVASQDARRYVAEAGLDAAAEDYMQVFAEGSNPTCVDCHGKGRYGSRAVIEVVPITRELLRVVSSQHSSLDEIDAALEAARRQASGSERGRNLTLAVQTAALFLDGQISEDAMLEAEITAEV